MPSALADALFDQLLASFPPERAYAPAAFEREPMPPPVAHFLTRLLQRRIEHEAEHLAWPRSPWLDHEHADVRRAQQALAEALARHGQYPPEAWTPALRQAVDEVTAYLVRPVSTLAAFVFQDGEAAVPSEVVERRLGYFAGYGYLHESVRMYFQQKNVGEIDPARFAELLRHIDRQMTQDYDAEAWLRLLAPVFDLARRVLPEAGVPVWLLRAFFDDKQAEAITQRLQTVQERRGLEVLDAAGLRRLLEPPAEIAAAPEVDRAARPAPAATPPDEPPQGAVPLWQQFQHGLAPAAQRPAPSGPARLPDEAHPQPSAPTREALPRWMQFRPDAAPRTPAPAPAPPAPTALTTLERTVLGEAGARHRDLFVRHLFGGDGDAYERVLRRLDAAPNWAEASRIIAEDVFKKNQVDIYSDLAVRFTDAAEARYA